MAGAVPPYEIPAVAIDHVPAEIGVPTGYWRGAAHSYTCFFTESFIDELARTANLEVLAFRNVMLVNNPRMARCLATAASIGGWDGGPPGSGMGLACHAAFGSYIAALVEVEVTNDQRLRVVRAVVAVDCGRTINPEIVKQQIEGGLVHGISAATGRPIEIVRGTPTIRHIGEYGLPTLRDAPEVSVELLESEEAPGGVTELAVPVAGPAVANAYFSLTGQRARDRCRSSWGIADEPRRRPPDQPRHARRGRAEGGAALSRRIPVGPPGGRDPAARLAADPARDHPHHAAEEIGACLSAGLDGGRLAARRLHRAAGEGAAGQVRAGRRASTMRCATAIPASPRGSTRCSRPAASASCWRRSIRNIARRRRRPPTMPPSRISPRSARQPALRTLPPYHDDPAYIDALKASVEASLAALDFAPEAILASFHGMPERTRALGDPYRDQCLRTAACSPRRWGGS